MAILEILRLGDSRLRKKSRELRKEEILSPKIQDLIQDMTETMRAAHGLGLAAPQVGENLCIALVEIPANSPRYLGAPAYPFGVYINPRIHVLDQECQENWEGCLSVPGMRGLVRRPKKIQLNYLDRHGQQQNLIAEGFPSTVFQHEFDHLDGLLFIDKAIDSRGDELHSLVATVKRLRAPGGCPWDQAQTHGSLRPFLVEEAYELLDVLDRVSDGGDLTKDFALKADFAEELGDVLLQVLLHAELAGELGAFNIQEVAFTLREKLIRRHPHVFSVNGAKNPEEALKNWESVKAEEKLASGREYEGILSGLPRHLPALQRTARVIEKVTKVGFQWPDLRGPIAKLEEELSEFRDELGRFELEPSEANRARLGEELGDFLFCLANVAFLLKIAPEDALRGCLSRFESRFRYVEKKVIESGRAWRDLNLDDLDVFWREAKELEKK